MIFSARKQPMVRIERALIKGFESSESYSCRVLIQLRESRKGPHLDERIDGKNNQFRLRFGIVHEVEIDKLLLFEIFCLHVLEDIWKEAGYVLPLGSVGWRDGAPDSELGTFPTVMFAMTRLIASFLFSRYSEFRSALSS
jgi:hypothetical protein